MNINIIFLCVLNSKYIITRHQYNIGYIYSRCNPLNNKSIVSNIIGNFFVRKNITF